MSNFPHVNDWYVISVWLILLCPAWIPMAIALWSLREPRAKP